MNPTALGRGTRLATLFGTCTLTLVATTGCRRSLFTNKEYRHQFQAYELSRDEYVPLQVPDVFGNPQPALRERLAPDR